MTTTTTTTTSNLETARCHALAERRRIEQRIALRRARALRQGRPAETGHLCGEYRDAYATLLEAKVGERIAERIWDGVDAVILYILSRTHRRMPLGMSFSTVARYAAHAGLGRDATLSVLKRLHAEGRVEYTGGHTQRDRGLWHPIHEGPKRDLGRLAYRTEETAPRQYEASCEVDGYAVSGSGRTEREALQELARRLRACGLTGTLTRSA